MIIGNGFEVINFFESLQEIWYTVTKILVTVLRNVTKYGNMWRFIPIVMNSKQSVTTTQSTSLITIFRDSLDIFHDEHGRVTKKIQWWTLILCYVISSRLRRGGETHMSIRKKAKPI
jgi:hypothetical protein